MNFPLLRQTGSIAFALSMLAPVAQAQTPSTSAGQAYPAKTIRMIVPFAAGGNTDIIARIVAPEMSKQFGHQIVIDNRGGGGSVIGSEIAAKSPPDGYTLLMVSAAHVINPAMVISALISCYRYCPLFSSHCGKRYMASTAVTESGSALHFYFMYWPRYRNYMTTKY